MTTEEGYWARFFIHSDQGVDGGEIVLGLLADFFIFGVGAGFLPVHSTRWFR